MFRSRVSYVHTSFNCATFLTLMVDNGEKRSEVNFRL